MKKIGIIARPDHSPVGLSIMMIYEDFRKIATDLGCIPIGIVPPTTSDYLKDNKTCLDEKAFIETLKLCDGFILQGGDNFYDYDLFVCKYAYERDIPLFGTCLGMQTIGVFLGGTYVEMEPNDIHKTVSFKEYAHDIDIKNDSLLYKILKNDTIKVNSRHKDTIIGINTKFVSATHKSIIEAIEDKTKSFFLGVQWHPENINDENNTKIFQAFINAVKKRGNNEKY